MDDAMTEDPGSEVTTLADTPAVVDILVANHRRFLAFVERRVGDRAAAEDLLQDAFVRGLAKPERMPDEDAIIPWFYRVLRNAVIDHYRRRGSAGRAFETLAAELDAAPDPESELHRVVCGCVADLARTLKSEYAAALQRVEVDGVAVKDFAAEAGITSGNAGVRVFRAREALRRQVMRSCGTCAEHGCLDCSCGASQRNP